MYYIGSYNISFEILSNRDIINFDLLKLHKPIKFFNTSKINNNQWSLINIDLHTVEENDLLLIILDNFDNTIELTIKNLKLFFVKDGKKNIICDHFNADNINANINTSKNDIAPWLSIYRMYCFSSAFLLQFPRLLLVIMIVRAIAIKSKAALNIEHR